MRLSLSILPALFFPLLVHASLDDQVQMTFPDAQSGADTYTPQTHAQPSLADLLTIEPAASIFYSYARETELSALFADENARLTLLVPTNKAVMALARKPHQGPAPVKEGVILPEAEFDALSKRNVERWVSAHIIPESPILLTPPHSYDTMLPGTSISFSAADPDKGNQDAPEWARVRLNGDIELIGMKEAQNGILYMIDGTVKFE